MMELISTENLPLIIVAIFTIYKYFDSKKREQNQREFKHFHKLIKDLVQPEKDQGIFLERQAAVLFELRNFKRYHEYSLRMLKGVPEEWKGYIRLNEEIKLTISFIEKKNWLRKKVGL